jgi:hypothetical protein
MIGFFFVGVGMIVFPVGYNWLGKDCRSASAEGCGLDCNSAEEGDHDFSYFRLCDPWKPGLAFLYAVIGSVCLMAGSIIINCVQLLEEYDEYDAYDAIDANE